jgi:hypothetical protein
MALNYYFNQIPGQEPWRNNLIYTSLISDDKKTFVQWYHNDSEYHAGKNQVVDPTKMEEKWLREINYITQMRNVYPDLVPTIINIDLSSRKLYLEIDGPDFWQQSLDGNCTFDEVLPDWQEQMLNIIKAHRSLGLWKYSMHPSSYFIVDGKLKSINYFFTYRDNENNISIKDVESHIYSTRQDELKKHITSLGIEWDKPQPFELLNELCWQSFSNMYPKDFIEKAKCIK